MPARVSRKKVGRLTIGFARVSTTKKAQDVSIAQQEKQLEKAGCDRVIVVRESGYKGPRHGWQELRRLVALGEVKEVICIDQSRLARDGDDIDFLEECALQNVTVRALTGGVIETESVGGFITAGVLSVMNKAYSRQLGIKSKDGLDRRKADGYYACGRVPFGYAYDAESGKVIPHPTDFDQARAMFLGLLDFEMNVTGFVNRTDCKWTMHGVRGWVIKPMLRGIVPNQPGGVRPVIEPEEWTRAEKLLAKRSNRHASRASYDGKKVFNTFAGLITCQACGKKCKCKRDRPRKDEIVGDKRYHCMTYGCDNYTKGIREMTVKPQVLNALTAAVMKMQQDQLQNVADAGSKEHPNAKEITEKKSQLAQLEMLVAGGVQGLDASIQNLHDELAVLRRVDSSPDLDWLAQLLGDALSVNGISNEVLRALVLENIESIFYVGNSLEVDIRVSKALGGG